MDEKLAIKLNNLTQKHRHLMTLFRYLLNSNILSLFEIIFILIFICPRIKQKKTDLRGGKNYGWTNFYEDMHQM